jgi:hypothetical protein
MTNKSTDPNEWRDVRGTVTLDPTTGLPEIPAGWYWKVDKGFQAYYVQLYMERPDIEVVGIFGKKKLKKRKPKQIVNRYVSDIMPSPDTILERAVNEYRTLVDNYGHQWWDVLPYQEEDMILGDYRPGGERRLGGKA